MNKPNIGREALKKLFTMISMRITGKKPKNIKIEEGMSIDEDGDLMEEMNINIDLPDGGKIIGKATHIDSPEKMMKIMEREKRKIKEKQEKMEQEYDQWIDEHYTRMGLIDDFKIQFPDVADFDGAVLTWIEDIEADDFIWLCSELKKLEKILDDDHLLNYRLCRTQVDELSEEYRQAQKNGCCKVFDHIIVNPKTKNKFSVGCNHDHYRPELDELLDE